MNLMSQYPGSVFWWCSSLLVAGIMVIGSSSAAIQPIAIVAKQEPQLENLDAVVSGIRVNLVEGELTYQRGIGRSSLDPGLEVKEGDVIRSGDSGRGELLLQPGNYLRVGEETELRVLGEPYDRLRLHLSKGTISFELIKHEYDLSGSVIDRLGSGYDLIRVATAGSEVFMTPPGIFRVNVAPDGHTEVVVRKGEALLNGERIKEKRSAIETHGVIAITEIDPKIEKPFDSWCRDRADKLIQANRSLKKDAPWVKSRKKGMDAIVDVPTSDEQGGNPYVVSAKPGTVSFVESGVEFWQGRENWQVLTDETDLDTGDTLRTSAHSHVELMVLPDIYLRLDGSSEMLLEQLSNDAISLKLINGSAIFDVATFNRKQLPPMIIGGPSSSVVVAEEGNYRIDVKAGREEITIREGKVIFREQPIGSCRRIVDGKSSECGRKRSDSFDFWSHHRGEGQSSNGRAMATRLARVRRSRLKWTGFWYQPLGLGYYTFVPFSSTHFRSPYGGGYSSVLSPDRTPMLFSNPGGRSMIRFPREAVAPVSP